MTNRNHSTVIQKQKLRGLCLVVIFLLYGIHFFIKHKSIYMYFSHFVRFKTVWYLHIYLCITYSKNSSVRRKSTEDLIRLDVEEVAMNLGGDIAAIP